METSRLSAGLTRRFVAGHTLEAAMTVCRRLHGERLSATIDQLGESVTTTAEAAQFRAGIEGIYSAIAASGLPLTVSIKLTQLGLGLSTELCMANTAMLAEIAASHNSRLEIDMESSDYVDRTLAIVEEMHRQYGHVRCVLQAYLYRTEEDLRRMNRLSIPVRLCKGAYDEPAAVAYPEKADVDRNYLKLARLLIAEGAFPAIATHDPRMIEGTLAAVRKTGRKPEEFEFQMLYGVRRDLQARLAARGYGVRLYVPYGDAWYPYFMRRLAERPANVVFIAKNLLRA
ncbi:MAG: proline dehydrogenase family protein [Bryobacteraceae bacterium]|jgi:proline dehydrogenase